MAIRRTEQNAKEAEAHAPSADARQPGEQRLQVGLYAYHRGDYTVALTHFEKACDSFSKSNQHEKFINCCTYLLRILSARASIALNNA